MPIIEVFWSIFLVFLLVAWIWVIISIIGDLFRSDDIGGFAKGIWIMFLILLPWLGILCYMIVRGSGMQERTAKMLSDANDAQRAYIQNVAGVSTADELSKLAELKSSGVLTAAEFDAQKAKLLTD